MSVQFENYSHSFKIKDKPVYAPSELGRRIGEDVKCRVEAAVTFEDWFFHLQPGGHVAALHAHRQNAYFCKVDITNFFYSISRNRVVRALRDAGVPRHRHYGKWSCIKNPYNEPSYALPYGFVQSPILASLVLRGSAICEFLRNLPPSITVAVYVDDISLSGNDKRQLEEAYEGLLTQAAASGFVANEAKCVPPTEDIEIFNCSLSGDRPVKALWRGRGIPGYAACAA